MKGVWIIDPPAAAMGAVGVQFVLALVQARDATDQESETFTTRTVLKDLHIAVDSMRGVAGCLVRVQKVSAAGSRVTLFENWYMTS